MKPPHFSPSTPFLRLVCLILCYSFVAPFLTIIPEGGVMEVYAAPLVGPIKATPPNKQAQTDQKPRWRDGELLIRFRPNARQSDADALLEANGAERAGVLRGKSNVERLRLSAGSNPEAAAAAMRASTLVDFVEPNYLITADQISPNDPRFSEQWALQNPAAMAGESGPDIRAAHAWEATTGSNETVIAVLDSGVDFTHPDLAANRWGNTFELAGNNLDDDRNGFTDDLHGWDFVNNSKVITDAQGHGTAVAGIIAAEGDNATGITGVMWRAGLMSLRVLDDAGTGDVAAAVEAMDYAVANGAQVINCSWGTDGASVALLDAISRAARSGVVVVASAGNGGRDVEAAPRYPASFDLNSLIVVASTDNSDQLTSWSNWGGTHTSLAAPGADILTTMMGGDYQAVSGSSASAAFVTGIVGLVKTLRPWLNADRTRFLILQGARRVPALSGKVASGGVASAAGALSALSTLSPAEGLEDGNGNNGNNGGEHGAHGRPDPRGNDSVPGIGGGGLGVGPLPTTTGAPGPGLPDLEELRRKQPTVPKAKPPVPSDRCSHRNPRCLDKGRASASTLLPSQMLALVLDLPDVGPLLKNVSGMVSDSSGPLAIFANSPAAFTPYEPPPTIEAVVWKNVVGATASGNDLTKTAGTAWGNAGAASTRAISYGDGYVEWTASETNLVRRVGLGTGDSNQYPGDITFAFQMYSGGVLHIIENGTSLGTFGTYATGDKLRVAVENGKVNYYQNGALLYASNLTPTYPLLVDTSLYNSGATIKDVIIKGVLEGPVAESVAWKNVVGATAAGNDLTKTGGTGWGNSGASSTRAISYGDGYVEWTASETNLVRRIGLGTGDSSQMPGDITFAFQMYTGGTLHVIENGTSLGTFGTYATGDKLRIAIEGGEVKYYRNGTLLHTSTVTPSYPLLVDTSLYTSGATITDVVISGKLEGTAPAQSVFWTNVVGADAVDNNLTKTAGTGWGNSGAVSMQSIPYGDGYVEWTASETNLVRRVGLGTGDSNQYPGDITFAFQMYSGGVLHIIENGTSLGTFGTYATGDKLRVAVENGKVNYYQNGALLYASNLTPTYPLLVDTSLYNSGATITGVTIQWEPGSEPSGENFATARLDPLNRTGQPGVDMLSRNINWSVPLVNLPGRAGLDLGLSLTYNSLVWTKSGSAISFDADAGTPAPGFRLGFPVIEPSYFNTLVGANAYILVTPSGGRVELRQVGTTNVYEAADSSYLQLTANANGTLTLRDTGGTRFSYSLVQGLYRCTQIKDRNGNFISATYLGNGNINTITDTLSRVLTFNYDGYENLISITQPWLVGTTTQSHAWATFGWAAKEINTSFTNLTMIGPQNQDSILVLSQVSLADGTRFNFEYNSYGQVETVKHYADDDHLLSYTSYTLPAATTDCPRPSQQKVWAENWNGDSDSTPAAGEEALTTYTFSVGNYGQALLPDNTTTYKEIFDTTPGWEKGLTTTVQIKSGTAVVMKTTALTWTQDDEALPYRKNPRPTEVTVTDGTNTRKTTISYTAFGLPLDVDEYNANGTAVLRRTHTDYHPMPNVYTDRRIIGLPSTKIIYSGTTTPVSKVTYEYDEGGIYFANQGTPTNHDSAGYPATFRVGRGNLTSVLRWDVDSPDDDTKVIESNFGYNNSGSVILTRDPLDHQTDISYADSFSDGVNRNTLAYPTKVTPPVVTGEEAENFESATQYNYDFGAVMGTKGPLPAGQTLPPEQTFEYDAAGRLSRVNNLVNGAYKRWVYYADAGQVSTFWKVDQQFTQEAQSTAVFDGAGRVRATGMLTPGTTNSYTGQYTYFDVMGRASKSTNPGQMASNWTSTANPTTGWVWTEQDYDWKGRPTETTNPDGTKKTVSYAGCGCAGGEIVTIMDEVNRQQKSFSDTLGRHVKTQELNWGGTVYSTSITKYNARDQVESVKVYQGAETSDGSCPTGTCQQTTMTYDGYGRLLTSKAPEQTSATGYTYNPDDTVLTVTDARKVKATYTYDPRRLITGITYNISLVPAGEPAVTATAPITYAYDPAGNRTQMTDGFGTTAYTYDRLSQLKSETKTLTDGGTLVGTFTLSYEYTWAGALKSVTDPYGVKVSYAYDAAGRMTTVTGTGGGAAVYASNMQYEASGALKQMSYGNGLKLNLEYNNRLQPTKYDLTTAANVRVMGREYQYTTTPTSADNDGRVKFSNDLVDDKLDRTYTYDYAGRMASAKAGVNQGSYYTGPFEQGYSYNVWGDLTGRTWRTFQTVPVGGSYYQTPQQNSYSENYVNHRNTATGWQYDADGRLLASAGDGITRQYTYDAAGQMRTSSETGKNITQAFDGDGQRVKFVENSTTTYYMRSSALGGQTLSEFDQYGVKRRTYVYANGAVVAKQEGAQVLWDHRDVSGVSMRLTNSTGTVTNKVETDPLGTVADDSNSYMYGGGGGGGYNPMGFYGDPSQPSMGCSSDMVPTPCSMVMAQLRSGAASQCPNGYCTSSPIPSRDGRGWAGVAYWNPDAAANGIGTGGVGVGYLPVGVRYDPDSGFYGNNVTSWFPGSVGRMGRDFFPMAAFLEINGLRSLPQYGHAQPQQGVAAQGSAPLTGKDLRNYNRERTNVLDRLQNNIFCRTFLAAHGISPDEAAAAVELQRAYNGPKTRISRQAAGLVDPSNPVDVRFGGVEVRRDFRGGTNAETALWPGGMFGTTVAARSSVYYRSRGITGATIVHEALHSLLGLLDPQLQQRLSLPTGGLSSNITQALRLHGCGS